MAGTFKFELVTPERMALSEDVGQVVVPGVEGDFTVLPGHAAVISALRPGIIDVTLPDARKTRIFVKGGFAEVDADHLTVLAERALDVEAMDAADHRRRARDGGGGPRLRHRRRRPPGRRLRRGAAAGAGALGCGFPRLSCWRAADRRRLAASRL